jgi:hypothetical protein
MTVAEFIAKIGLDSTKFTEGTNKVKRDVASLKGEIGKFAPALAGAFTVAGLVGLGKKAIETGAHFYDMAQKLGVSTDSIQRLDFAAQQTGIDIDKVTRAILKMQGELSHGGWDKDKYASALKALKLKPEELVGKSPEDVLIRLADAFQGVNNRAEANAAIVSLVGIKMAGVIPLLARGGAALKELFGRAPVAEESSITAMKQLKQQWDELGRVSFPYLAKMVQGFAFLTKGVLGTLAVLKATVQLLAATKEAIGTLSLKSLREDATKIEDELYTTWGKLFKELPSPGEGSFVGGEHGPSDEEKRHAKTMENLDAEREKLLQNATEAGLAAEQELAAKEKHLRELEAEFAKLRAMPSSPGNTEAVAENENAWLKALASIAEVQQRIDRERQAAAEALAKKTQDVEDARFQNSLILMSAEEKRIALLQREQELVQQITKLREGGQAQAAIEREKDLESLRAEQLRLDKKDEQQPSAGGQPFSVFTNELQRRGGAGAAVVGYGGNEVLNVAKQQLETQKRTEKLIFELNQRAQQNLSTSGVFS